MPSKKKIMLFEHEIQGARLNLYERDKVHAEGGDGKNVLVFLSQVRCNGNVKDALEEAFQYLIFNPVRKRDPYQSTDMHTGQKIRGFYDSTRMRETPIPKF